MTDLRKLLAQAVPAERSQVLLAWLQRQGRHSAEAVPVDLQGMDLSGAQLRGAALEHANLEQANLERADLAAARLRGARLGEARMQGAMLEEADLREAVLRYAHAPAAVLENSRLCDADLWGANLQEAQLLDSDASGAIFDEAILKGADLSGVDFTGARLRHADLSGANLSGADLEQVQLSRTKLDGANLRGARLQGLTLQDCSLHQVRLAGAWLDRTRLHQAQLGGAIGEEVAQEFAAAVEGYRSLQINFEALGDADAAIWAYLKRKRMQKRMAATGARQAWRQRHWVDAARCALRSAVLQLVEWLCNCGESIPRVLAAMLLVYVGFIPVYAMTDAVVKVQGEVRSVTHSPRDLAVYSLMVMTTSGQPPGFEGRTDATYAMAGVQALIGISLTGLLGFVLGNRIHR